MSDHGFPADKKFVHAPRRFSVSLGMLARCGHQIRVQRPSRMKPRAARQRHYRADHPGNLATLLLPGAEGKVGQTEEISCAADQSTISSFVDMNP